MIQRRTLSQPGDEMSRTETAYRNAVWERHQALAFGATPEKLAPLEAKIAALKEKLERPKQVRQKSMEPSEHQEQASVITWWMHQYKVYGLPRNALFAIPNAQHLIQFATNKHAFMAYLRSEGFRDGMLDMMLAVPKAPFSGLFIEMKRLKGGTVSDEQSDNIQMFHQLGYAAGIQRGAASAISAIKHYLGRA